MRLLPSLPRLPRLPHLPRLAAPVALAFALLLLTAGCASLPPRGELAASRALDNTSTPTALGQQALAARAGRPAGQSGMRLLMHPQEALDARLALIAQAQRTLDVQYYIFEGDETGLLMLQALQAAAARGVRVRLLVDDLQLAADGPGGAPAHEHMEVRVFNPLPARQGGITTRVLLSLHDFRRINHRMHNKLLVADGSYSISGGRNIADEYFMRGAQANFLDLDVLAVGELVDAQSAAFDRYWNSAQAWPLAQLQQPMGPQPPREGAGPPPAPPAVADGDDLAAQRFTWAPVRVFVDDPAKMQGEGLRERFAQSVSAQTLEVIDSAHSRVVIATPYFIPGETGMAVMARAKERGVTTIIITNSLGATDEPLVHAAYARYRPQMLALGVTLYEVSPTLSRRLAPWGNLGRTEGRLHAKLALVDSRWMYVGSMNLDGRSASLNTESGLLIDSPPLVAQFLERAGPQRFSGAYEVRLAADGSLQWLEDGGATVHASEPDAGVMQQLRSWLVLPLLDEELL